MRKRGGSYDSENPILILVGKVRRAFSEFLFIPTLLIAGFLCLAVISYLLDSSEMSDPGPLRTFLVSHIFADSEATSSLLGAIAAGVITMTSITISLLLIAVQQSASSLTGQVYDQFLRRRANQIHFGFFIGLALYSLITLATVNDPFNPVFGAAIAFIATGISLYLLIVLLYSTIDQMRPVEIIEAIHEHVLAARSRQKELIHKTRREARHDWTFVIPVRTEVHGYLNGIDLDQTAKACDGRAELKLLVSIGSFVAFKDVIAEARAGSHEDAEKLAAAAGGALKIDRQRDIGTDPGFGIEQLEMIGWTSVSTSKSNPAPGLLVIQCLRDIMARWSDEEKAGIHEATVPLVYNDDVFERLLQAFETLAVVSSESMQHQIFIGVLRTFTVMWDRLPSEVQDRVEDLLLRVLSVLGDHVLTSELDVTLSDLASKLETHDRKTTADAVRCAHLQLSRSVGKLGSRSTRAEA